MKSNYFDPKKIMQENNVHSTFLNEDGLVSALEQSYNQGVNDVLRWIEQMDDLSDNVKYLVEEWNNQHK